jgi:hypothetical protein
MGSSELQDLAAEIHALLHNAIDNDQAIIVMLETFQTRFPKTDPPVSELIDIQALVYRNAAILKDIRRLFPIPAFGQLRRFLPVEI